MSASPVLSRPLSLDDDAAAAYLARMAPDSLKPAMAEAKDCQTEHNAQPSVSVCSPPPPPLPARNALRRSRFLDLSEADVDAMSGRASTEEVHAAPRAGAGADAARGVGLGIANPVTVVRATPHDIYLSSEEDASSAGDFSDLDVDVDADYDDEDDDGNNGVATLSDDDDDEDENGRNGARFDATEHSISLAPAAKPTQIAPLPAISTQVAAVPSSASAGPVPSVAPVFTANPLARRYSHDTARVVSVIFSGKPALVDLVRERQIQINETNQVNETNQINETNQANQTSQTNKNRHQSCFELASMSALTATASSMSGSTSATSEATATTGVLASRSSSSRSSSSSNSSVDSSSHNGNGSNSSNNPNMMASFSTRKSATSRAGPSFLNIDPFANGSTYSLVTPSTETMSTPLSASNPFSPAPPMAMPSLAPLPSILSPASPAPSIRSNTPRTPSTILRGVTRSLTLSRRRSRPLLREASPPATATGDDQAVRAVAAAAAAATARATTAEAPVERQYAAGMPPPIASVSRAVTSPLLPPPSASTLPQNASFSSYNGIIRSVRRKSMAISLSAAASSLPLQRPQTPQSASSYYPPSAHISAPSPSPSPFPYSPAGAVLRPETPDSVLGARKTSSSGASLLSGLAARRRSIKITRGRS